MIRYRSRAFAGALTLAAIAFAGAAHAHGPAASDAAGAAQAGTPDPAEETVFGRPGTPDKLTRTITIDMQDTMRFGPADIRVRRGETIRFVVHNKGRLMHEMVLGTLEELKQHAEMMRQNPGMEHDAPYMAHVAPGKRGRMVWQFTTPGEFHYACLMPGHFEAGMVGRITVVAA